MYGVIPRTVHKRRMNAEIRHGQGCEQHTKARMLTATAGGKGAKRCIFERRGKFNPHIPREYP